MLWYCWTFGEFAHETLSRDARVTRSTLVILLKYALGLGILAGVVFRNWDVKQEDGQQVGLSIMVERPIHGGLLAMGLGICVLGTAVTFVRWYYLVIAQGLPIGPRDVVRLGLLGFFFNTFLPGSVGGDLVKAAFLVREHSRRTLAVATVVADRVIGLAGLFWMVAILGGGLLASGSFDALLAEPSAKATLETILAFACAVVTGTIVVWVALGLFSARWLDRMQDRLETIPKIGHPLAELVRAVRVYREKGRFVALALGLSMIGHFCFVLSFYFGARVFNDADQLPPLLAHLLIVPIGMTIRSLIPLPGGIGGAEIGYGKLYEWVGFPFASGVLGSIGQLACMLILGMVGFIVYQIMDKRPTGEAPPVLIGDERDH
jgi:glycosyltransferase 2 family protein